MEFIRFDVKMKWVLKLLLYFNAPFRGMKISLLCRLSRSACRNWSSEKRTGTKKGKMDEDPSRVVQKSLLFTGAAFVLKECYISFMFFLFYKTWVKGMWYLQL